LLRYIQVACTIEATKDGTVYRCGSGGESVSLGRAISIADYRLDQTGGYGDLSHAVIPPIAYIQIAVAIQHNICCPAE